MSASFSSHKWSFLTAILTCILVFPQSLRASNSFKVLSDLEVVEKVVIDYVIMDSRVTDISGSQESSAAGASTEPERSTQPAPETSGSVAAAPTTVPPPARTRGLCSAPRDVVLNFCHEFVTEKIYAFDTALEETSGELACEYRAVRLTLLHQQHIGVQTVNMLKCPQIVDVELFPGAFTYYVSETLAENTAVVYAQRNSHSPIRPLKYVYEIDATKLGQKRIPSPQSGSPTPQVPYQLAFEHDMANIWKRVSDLLALRKIRHPYRKFIRTCHAFNGCELRRTQKAYFCQNLIHSNNVQNIELEVDEFVDFNCRRRTLTYNVEGNVHIVDTPQFRCPTTAHYANDNSGIVKKTFDSRVDLFSTDFSAASVFLFSLENREFAPKAAVSGLPFARLQTIKEWLKNRPIKIQDDAIEPTSIPKFLRDHYDPAVLIEYKRGLAERAIMNLHKGKSAPAHQKFQIHHRRINVTGLFFNQKANLCDQVYGNQFFGFVLSMTDPRAKVVFKEPVDFYVHKLDYVMEGAVKFSLIKCLVADTAFYDDLFLIGGLEDDTVIAAVRGYNSANLTPLTVVRVQVAPRA